MGMTKFTEQRRLHSFLSKIGVDNSGCWIWRAAKVPGRGLTYGQFYNGDKTELAHRFSYRVFKGTIPHKITVDHICRVPLCVNPEHLRLLTMRDNILCGNGPTAQHARQTHCKWGHKFDKKNTRIRSNERCCMECARIHQRKVRLAKKALGEGGE